MKSNPKLFSPATNSVVEWCGFICAGGARRLSFARKGKLIASSVTNGGVVASQWRDLASDEYCLCMLVLISEGKFGAFGVVDNQGWPIVISEHRPLLKIVGSNKPKPCIKAFAR